MIVKIPGGIAVGEDILLDIDKPYKLISSNYNDTEIKQDNLLVILPISKSVCYLDYVSTNLSLKEVEQIIENVKFQEKFLENVNDS